ncbi:MAG TPA: RidA family protein [bacterium]|nr:RidA family protein [bacterium]
MRVVHTDQAPAPGGHYSQAVIHDGWIFVSGQLPIDPVKGPVRGDVDVQTGQVLQNILSIVEAAGGSKSQIVKITVYVSDISLWDRVNTVYGRFFENHRPARSVVPVCPLHYGFQVEMDAVAFLTEQE